MRNPVVAGQFYPENPDDLKSQIKECFLSNLGPGNMPKKANNELKAVISPHAGFLYSGPCAAFAYKEIAESKTPDLFIILGVSHSGNRTCISLEPWKTPLGIVEIDKDFAKELNIPQDESAHLNEHSIEVQLPFLQFIKDKPIILPILVSDDISPKQLANQIKKALIKTKKQAIIIASGDFTHFGESYGYTPKENIKEIDKKAINEILKLDSSEFVNYINKTKATICGKNPIAVLIEIIKPAKAELLKYYTSEEISKDNKNAVGYAAIKFK